VTRCALVVPPNPLQPSADRCTAPLLRHCVALCGAAFRLCGFAADEQVCLSALAACAKPYCEPNLSARADAFVLSSVAHRPRLPSAEGFVCVCVGTAGCDELEQEHQAAADGHSLFPRREARTGQQRRLAEYSPPECPLLSSPFLAARADYPSGQHLRFADALRCPRGGKLSHSVCGIWYVECGMRYSQCHAMFSAVLTYGMQWATRGTAALMARRSRFIFSRERCASLTASQGLH
jgi:hypothetical protein